LGSFALNIGEGNAFLAELTDVMIAIEIVASKNWVRLWLESDSRLVLAFSKPSMVPWRIRNRWMNALLLTKSMRFMTTRIYREGNHCADKFANIGLTIQAFTW
jgi:ribonuclease HI